MPALNHRMSDVERSTSVYTVDVTEQNAGPDGESAFEKDTYFMDSFKGALTVAVNEMGEEPRVRIASTGMTYLYEPHGAGEKYLQAVIRERRLHSLQ